MKVKLLQDYRGVLTNEAFFTAGEHDMADDMARALVNDGRAEALEPSAKPAPKTITKKAARK
jgi:hypothetical protein